MQKVIHLWNNRISNETAKTRMKLDRGKLRIGRIHLYNHLILIDDVDSHNSACFWRERKMRNVKSILTATLSSHEWKFSLWMWSPICMWNVYHDKLYQFPHIFFIITKNGALTGNASFVISLQKIWQSCACFCYNNYTVCTLFCKSYSSSSTIPKQTKRTFHH